MEVEIWDEVEICSHLILKCSPGRKGDPMSPQITAQFHREQIL